MNSHFRPENLKIPGEFLVNDEKKKPGRDICRNQASHFVVYFFRTAALYLAWS